MISGNQKKSQNRARLSESVIERFVKEGWPETLMVSGPQTTWKKDFLISMIIKSLNETRRDDRYSPPMISEMVRKNEHPDFYYFAPDRVKIGDKKKPEPGSVRHMIEHFLAYAPRMSRERFVFFEDASQILDEAESALLKSLEEAPTGTHFILSVEEAAALKETIISRCIEIPLNQIPDLEKTPNDPWERFWFLSEWNETAHYRLIAEKGWTEFLKESYDRLKFSPADYTIFEDIGWTVLKKKFSDESQDSQTTLMKISFYPLYCAVRDRMINGQAPQLAPFALPTNFSSRKLFLLAQTLDVFFQRLSLRYFNTRIPALNVLYFAFLARFMRLWSAEI